MHCIIVGCGDVGSQLATLLSTEGHDVVVIDKNPIAFKHLGTTFNGITVTGYGFDNGVLKEAGIDKCDAFAAVTNQDNSNMMASEMASKIYKIPKVVARLYDEDMENAFLQLGLDYICGTTMIAQSILEKLVEGHGHHLIVRRGMEIIEFVAGSAVHLKTIKDIQIPNEFRICLVTRNGSTFIPWRDSILHEQDTLLAVLKSESHDKISKYIRKV